MQTDEQKRDSFAIYLKQLMQEWIINPETGKCIINVILRHKGVELDAYIARFKIMVGWMEKDIKTKPDISSENHPADGKYIDSFIGADISIRSNYASNYSLRLFFSRELKEIYKFLVLK